MQNKFSYICRYYVFYEIIPTLDIYSTNIYANLKCISATLYKKNTLFYQNIFHKFKYLKIILSFQLIINDVIYFRWIKSSDIKKCELCKFTFVMQSKVKRHLQKSFFNHFTSFALKTYLRSKHMSAIQLH